MAEDATAPPVAHRHDHPLRQLLRFGFVGGFTLVLDFVTYRGLLLLDLPISPAKAAGFVVGTTAAYLLNRTWTFRATGGRGAVLRFLVLYAGTLVVNVAVNALGVHVLEGVPGRIEISFLVAQAVSSALNFVGLRHYVFHPRRSTPVAGPAG